MLFRESIFMTGFPGFIASRLVERLAGSEKQFFLLVEPRFVDKAMEEAELIANEQGVPLESFVIVEGDIAKPDLGIAADDLEIIRSETTSIFHLAAVYDLGIDKDLAYRVNLDGTRNVNAFARSIQNLRRYNYVSTCYVAGRRTGKILETDLAHDSGFRNYYEETKYLAELEVEKLKAELPVTIYRPSVVVGDSETGETPKYDGIYYLILYLRKAPSLLRLINVGNDKVRLNLVPVDFVVDAIAALSGDAATLGKTLQIADPSPLTTAELFDAIAKELTGRKSEFTPPTRLVEWFLNLSVAPPVTGLPNHGVPYFFVEQMYDTKLTSDALKPHGIKCPPFHSYIGNLLDFVDEFPTL
jgi:nucleoside-diphosphate-sugar epimerase